jgi:membrane protein YdbS with pleckstrin-like domain
MLRRTINPSRRYLAKLRLILTIVVLLILALVIPMLWLITDDANTSSDDSTILYGSVLALNLLWYIPGMLLTGPYYRSLNYEIQEDEVIVRAGIWTHSVKHVPYRTVTNLTIKRGILDRWLFGLGSLHIQTAGMSGTSGAEEILEGLSDVQEVYALVVRELGRFRGGMAPTTTELEADVGSVPTELDAILVELRAIRHALESR